MDRRQSFRFPCSGERSDARVELPGRSCAATLLDESTGGFRLQVNEADLICEPDQQLQLKTYRGWHEVQVVRSAPCETGLELGLLRLEDYVNEESISKSKKPRRTFRRPAIGSMRGEYFIGLAILLVVPLMPMLFQKLIVIPVQQPVENEQLEFPTLAGKASEFVFSGPSEPMSGTTKHLSRKLSTGVRQISKTTDQVIDVGSQGVKHVLEGTTQLVHDVLTTLSIAGLGRLENVVDAYAESPSSENLKRFENLLEEPEYDSLHQLVDQGQTSLPELAGLIFTEFHRN